MRVIIFTSGRFHLLDLARELDKLGVEVIFRSCVPTSRAAQFELPERCCRPIRAGIPLQYIITRSRREKIKCMAQWAQRRLLDRVGALGLPDTDVFIGISGMSGPTARKLRARGTPQIWIERGSRHILSQKAILEEIGVVSGVKEDDIDRELADYALADRVVVPSKHVVESFIEAGFQESKLFRNPYGTDISMFPFRQSTPVGPPTVLMAGTWSRRKGCDILLKAWEGLPETRLIHVGARGDVPMPTDNPRFKTYGFVDQRSLGEIYSTAHVGVLASREEGLAVVQAQMLATGLRLVCSDRTGGVDLGEACNLIDRVTEVKNGNVEALKSALHHALKVACAETIGERNRVGSRLKGLSWGAYAKRYFEKLNNSKTETPEKAS